MERLEKNNRVLVSVATAALVLAVIIWGFTYVFQKTALNNNTPPLLQIAAESVIGGAVCLPLLFLKRKKLRQTTMVKQGAILGAMLTVSRVLQTIGCEMSTAGKNAFITSIYVVLTPLFMWLFMKERPRVKSVAAALAALVGLGLISVNGSEGTINAGDLITFCCAIGYALHIVYTGYFDEKSDAFLLGILQIEFTAVFSAVIYLPSMLITHQFFSLEYFTPVVTCCIIYCGVLGTAAGFLLQTFGQKYLEQEKAAMILCMESVAGALCSIVFLHEIFTVRMVVGCAIILAAIFSQYLKIPRHLGRVFPRHRMH